jgi:hypothetical protein
MAGKTLWTVLRMAVALGVLAGPAAAQQSPLMPRFSLGDAKHKLTPEEQARQDALDNAYKSATNKIPDQKTANDPWATVRTAPAAPGIKKQKPPQ